jgi:hypothetical protein
MSDEWLTQYEVALNNNDACAKVASWWIGDFIFIVRASGNAKIQGTMAKVFKATDAAKELVRTANMIDSEFY